jgi:ubiquinone/menaquinone biosynthesis C-methylase UbiE
MINYYDEIAQGYEELHKEEQEKKIELIKSHISINPNDKLLDVGCGTGLTTEPWGCSCYGIDPSKGLLERARQRDKIEYKLAPAEDIPYPDDFFDIVVSVTAIQNFDDVKKGLNEIKRVCKNKVVLSFLKKSTEKDLISSIIKELFKIKEIIEEEKDLIFFGNI